MRDEQSVGAPDKPGHDGILKMASRSMEKDGLSSSAMQSKERNRAPA
jgi:hypothetical protein